jgi:DNA-binding transcriptional regulator YiaG
MSTVLVDISQQNRHTAAMLTSAQSRGARGILEWTQERLAAEAGVSLSTVKDFESGRRRPIGNNLSAMKRALEAAGVEFTNGNQPGVRLSKATPTAPPGVSKPSAATKATRVKKKLG